MGRLTKRDSKGWYVEDQSVAFSNDGRRRGDSVDRLAAYEDTGLEPEEIEAIKNAMMGKTIAEITEFEGVPIDRLRELVQAERDGRLVVTPCKVGDTVYVTNELWISQYVVSSFRYDGLFFHFKAVNEEYVEESREFSFFDERIGKTVFHTREEAEAALEAQKGETT